MFFVETHQNRLHIILTDADGVSNYTPGFDVDEENDFSRKSKDSDTVLDFIGASC